MEADLVEGVEEAEAGVHHLQPAGLAGREVVVWQQGQCTLRNNLKICRCKVSALLCGLTKQPNTLSTARAATEVGIPTIALCRSRRRKRKVHLLYLDSIVLDSIVFG